MPVAALQTWLRVQAAVWLPALVVLGVCGATGPVPGWPHVLLAGIAVSFASLAWILRAGSVADLVTMARVALLLVVIGLGAGKVGFVVWAAAATVVLLDLVDGALARRFGASPGGAVLDMEADQLTTLGLAALAAIGSVVTSYARAKGESVGIDPNVGYMQRHERAVYLGVPSVLSPLVAVWLEPQAAHPRYHLVICALGLLAVLTNLTAYMRTRYVFVRLRVRTSEESPES